MSVFGSRPYLRSSSRSDAMPSTSWPFGVSASRTQKPFSGPVGIPRLALGQRLKSRSMTPGLLVAPHLFPLLYFADL